MLDETEFLSPHGIRSVSRYHRDHPYSANTGGVEHRMDYEPGESTTGIFGGNSNWRGPIWFPINYLDPRVAHAATTSTSATTSRSSAPRARAG